MWFSNQICSDAHLSENKNLRINSWCTSWHQCARASDRWSIFNQMFPANKINCKFSLHFRPFSKPHMRLKRQYIIRLPDCGWERFRLISGLSDKMQRKGLIYWFGFILLTDCVTVCYYLKFYVEQSFMFFLEHRCRNEETCTIAASI